VWQDRLRPCPTDSDSSTSKDDVTRQQLSPSIFDPESESESESSEGETSAGLPRRESELAWLSTIRDVWDDREALEPMVESFLSGQSAEFRENPKKFPDLPSQLIKLLAKASNDGYCDSTRRLTDSGSASCSHTLRYSVGGGLTFPHIITWDLDVPADMYASAFTVDFWQAFLETCLHNQKDYLPIQGQQQDAPLIASREKLFFFDTPTKQRLALLIGTTQYEWLNPIKRTMGKGERLWCSFLRADIWRDLVTLPRHCVPSDSGPDSDIESETEYEGCIDPPIRKHSGDDHFHFLDETYPLDAQHPINTLYRFQGVTAEYQLLRGRARPNSHIAGYPFVSALGVRGGELGPRSVEKYRIESVRPMHEILEGRHFVLEIVSRALCIDFESEQRSCRRPPPTDSRFFRMIFGVLEQVFYEGKMAFLYSGFFSKDWVTFKPARDGQFEATFDFPTDAGRGGVMASAIIRLAPDQPDRVLEVHTTLMEVGNRLPFYLDDPEQGTMWNNMIGHGDVSLCRAALNQILTDRLPKLEINTYPDTCWLEDLRQNDFFSQFQLNHSRQSTDPRDLRNFAGNLEVLAAGSNPRQLNFDPKCSVKSYRVDQPSEHELVQTAVFSMTNFAVPGPNIGLNPIARISVIRGIRETDEQGKTLSGRRKEGPYSKSKAIHVKIIFESVQNISWPPKNPEPGSLRSKEGAAIDKLKDYLWRNGVNRGCVNTDWGPRIVHVFTKGGSVNLCLNDQWDRFFYMGKEVSTSRKVEKLVETICVLIGSVPPSSIPLTLLLSPTREMLGTAFVKGSHEVPDMHIRIKIEENADPSRGVEDHKLMLVITGRKENDGSLMHEHGGITSSNTALLNEDEVRDVLLFVSMQCLCDASILYCSPLAGFGLFGVFGRDFTSYQRSCGGNECVFISPECTCFSFEC
jgi:hypothetical protein